MPGFDTLKLWLPSYEAMGCDFLAELPIKLSNAKVVSDFNQGETIVLGQLKNLKVSVCLRGISIQGSANKFILGQNIDTINRIQSKQFVESLSDHFSLPLKNAKVSRIDFSDNMIMEYSPENYFKLLGGARYYKRYELDKGLKYDQSKSKLVFYDKIAEMSHSRIEIPENFKGLNVLRYEAQLKPGMIKKMFGKSFTASALYDEKTYNELETFWAKNYRSIFKDPIFNLNFPMKLTNKKITQIIKAEYYQKFGSMEKALLMVDQLQAEGRYTNRAQINRHRNEIKAVFRNPLITAENELIKELNGKIEAKIKN